MSDVNTFVEDSPGCCCQNLCTPSFHVSKVELWLQASGSIKTNDQRKFSEKHTSTWQENVNGAGWKQGTNLLSIHHEPGTLEITSLCTIPLLFILYFGHFLY